MKILFCIDTMIKGGAERVVANLANYLVANNDIYIVTLKNTEVMYEIKDNVKVIKLDEEEFETVQKAKKKNFLHKVFKNIDRLKKYKNVVLNNEIDVIVSFLPMPSYLSAIVGKITKKKLIISVRNDPKIEYSSKINYFLMKKLYKYADKLIFQTQEAKEYFDEEIQRKGIIIPNPLNSIYVDSCYSGERRKEIVCVGRLEEQKNHRLLIRAFSHISKKFPDYKLGIYGEGSLQDELEEIIEQLNLNNKVILHGVSNNIKQDIEDAMLFILTSDYEGMPNALMEAMALGLPVISTDCPCGGPRFLINNKENGILIPVGDEQALIKEIEFLLNNRDEAIKMGKKASKISNILAPTIISKKWEEAISELLN